MTPAERAAKVCEENFPEEELPRPGLEESIAAAIREAVAEAVEDVLLRAANGYEAMASAARENAERARKPAEKRGHEVTAAHFMTAAAVLRDNIAVLTEAVTEPAAGPAAAPSS